MHFIERFSPFFWSLWSFFFFTVHWTTQPLRFPVTQSHFHCVPSFTVSAETSSDNRVPVRWQFDCQIPPQDGAPGEELSQRASQKTSPLVDFLNGFENRWIQRQCLNRNGGLDWCTNPQNNNNNAFLQRINGGVWGGWSGRITIRSTQDFSTAIHWQTQKISDERYLPSRLRLRDTVRSDTGALTRRSLWVYTILILGNASDELQWIHLWMMWGK